MAENVNCLVGMKCPKCGSPGPLRIEIQMVTTMSDDGSQGDGDLDWRDDAYCQCDVCAHTGKAADFEYERKLFCAGIQLDLARNTEGEWGGHVTGPASMDLDEDQEPDEATAQDMLQSLVLAHACAGIDVSSRAYQEGVRTAVEAWGNQ